MTANPNSAVELIKRDAIVGREESGFCHARSHAIRTACEAVASITMSASPKPESLTKVTAFATEATISQLG